VTPGKQTGIRIHGHYLKPDLTKAVRKKRNVRREADDSALDYSGRKKSLT
jgi:hypothetical protein